MDIQKIFDAFPNYILLLDDNHRILMANTAIKDALGVDPAEITGGYCPKLVQRPINSYHQLVYSS